MRNRRGAFWALGLAGAAYLWRNRGKLQQQAGNFNQQRQNNQLPDYRSNDQYNQNSRPQSDTPGRTVGGSSPFGGTEV